MMDLSDTWTDLLHAWCDRLGLSGCVFACCTALYDKFDEMCEECIVRDK